MFQNYLKIALRHISRNKGYVSINIVGLGIALACSMIAFVNYQAGKNADNFHENYDKIFRVITHRVGHTGPTVDIATPIVPKAVEAISGVEAGVRFHQNWVTIQNDETVFGEKLVLVDPSFFDVFTFNVKSGDAAAIKDPSKIILSEKKAKSYFGEEDPIGKMLIINPSQKEAQQMIVGAVIADRVAQISSLEFDFLTNINYLERGPYPANLDDWRTAVNASFLLLNDPKQRAEIEEQLTTYIPIRNEMAKRDKGVNYLLQPMNKVFMDGKAVNNNELKRAVSPAFYWAPGLLALMILLTACLNLTNTTISFSNKRLKEMGVRKVMGGGRKQLVFQLMGESLVICLLAVVVGVVLAEYLTPYYNQMWSSLDLELSLDYFQNPELLAFLFGMTLITTILGGAYPAFYISSFRPSQIFRGSTQFGGDTWLIRSLLGLQIAISLIAIIGGITMTQNAEFQENHDLGYKVNELINVSIHNSEEYTRFKNIILENPDIQGVTGSQSNMGFGDWDNMVGKPEDNRHAQTHVVGEDYLKVVGLKLVAGRTFDENLETDYKQSVLVTEKFVKESNWDNPIGQKVTHHFTHEKTVIGVVEDFYARSFYQKPRAAVFHFNKPERSNVMKIRVATNKLATTKQYLKDKWTENFLLTPFDGYYQDRTLVAATLFTKNATILYLFLAIITILLSATGLYSLVSLNVLKRSKEIAVRRVLGATAENIMYTVNKHYILIFAVGGLIGALIGVELTNFLLTRIFEVVSEVSVLSTVLAVVGICSVGALTIGGKLFSVLQANPAETLKSE